MMVEQLEFDFGDPISHIHWDEAHIIELAEEVVSDLDLNQIAHMAVEYLTGLYKKDEKLFRADWEERFD